MNAEHPLQPVVAQWLRVIRAGNDVKKRRFGADADECMMFFTGPYDKFWASTKQQDKYLLRPDDPLVSPETGVKVQVNKAAEFVQLFGPALYSRNPTRRVTTRTLPELPAELYAMTGDPMAQQQFMMAQQQDMMMRQVDETRAALIESYLNITPGATGLREQARMCVDEALIKGMSLLWPEPYKVPGSGHTIVGSQWGTIDDLIIDPDARSRKDAKWIARRCIHPTWEVERMYGLPPGALAQRGAFQSFAAGAGASALDAEGDNFWSRRDGKSNDMMVYWKVWSKMGCGGRLSQLEPQLRPMLEIFGDFCHIVVADGVPYPLNVPPDVLNHPNGAEMARDRFQWPTPFWADNGAWPFVEIAFHEVANDVWPMAHLAPALGELKLINWIVSHASTKIKATSRTFMAILGTQSEEIIDKILHGGDLELIKLRESANGNRTINDIVQFLQQPPFNKDIWNVLELVMSLFDKRTGLTELMYGESGRQMRSGTEAQLKGDAINIRPDDMAEVVEAAMSRVGRAEAFAARWHCSPQDVVPVLGPTYADWWMKLVYAADPRTILDAYDYRVEAGSARKPNKSRDQEQATAIMNNLFSPMMQYFSATGDPTQLNALMKFFLKAQEVSRPEEFMFQPRPVMPAPAPGAAPNLPA